ncbi:MAG: hypothetical protein LBT37_07195 [Lactobacillaceae bacterium]|nr:hypothetical protein [Lactobacillaceae bacterium]
MTNKPKLFFDMDNMLVDTLPVLDAATTNLAKYGVEKPDQIPGIFRHLKPIDGAVEAVNILATYYDTYILSTAPWNNPSSWSDKIEWLNEYFGNDADSPFYKKVILTHEKGVARANGGILIDDRPYHGAAEWDDEEQGTFWLQYGYDPKLIWGPDGQLVDLLIETAELIKTSGQTERVALLEANQKFGFKLHGSLEKFTTSSWEDAPK